MSINRYNRNESRIPPRFLSKPAAPLNSLNVGEICETNRVHGPIPKTFAKQRPCIWYFLDEKLNVPDQHLSIPPLLFGRN